MAKIKLTERCAHGAPGKVIDTDDPDWFIKRNWGQLYETGSDLRAETRETRSQSKKKRRRVW